MSQDTRPAPLDDSATAAALAEFRITQPQELTRWLQQLRDSSAMVVLNGPGGLSYCTTLWTLDSANGRMTFSADEQHVQLQRLVDSDEVVAVAYLDNIKLQFDVHQPVIVRGTQGCALQARLPREMFRFQRRNSFRVRTADRQGPKVQLRHPSMPDMQLNLRVLDVVPPLQPGTRFQRVRVDLDADTRFHASIVLHHVAGSTHSNGLRLGCEWVDMDAAAQRALQRFIDSTQKRRHFLSLA
jgi:flagellar brake protein